MEQVVNKEHIFIWLKYLKKNNPLYENIKINETEINDEIDIMSDQLISELVTYDEFRIYKDLMTEKKGSEENKITEDLIIQEDSSDSEDEKEAADVVDAVEALDEKEVSSHDTFLYHVNELCLEEKTITNGIAKFIDDKDRKKFKLKDEFCPDPEFFLFKDDAEDEFCSDAEIKDDIEKEDSKFFKEPTLVVGKTKSKKNAEKIIKSTNTEDIFSKSFLKKSKRKSKDKDEEREKATVVAPGENQPFDNMFRLQEEKCFPELFVLG